MGLNRFKNDRFLSEEKLNIEHHVKFLKPCCVCGTTIVIAYYAKWGEEGVCSNKCDGIMQDKQLYLRRNI